MDSSAGDVFAYFADLGLLFFALFLVLLNGFFVAAEFAMVKLRGTRVEAIADTHGWRGQILRKVHQQLDAYLSACQLGITLASLGLGWVGEPAFAHLVRPLLIKLGVDSEVLLHGLSFFLAFFTISYLHIVVGELAPKSWAIRQPERLSLWTAVPLYLFYWLMYPAIFLLNASANGILRLFGQGRQDAHLDHPYSRDELKLIFNSGHSADPEDRGMQVLASVVEMGDLEVSDWANSREDLISLPLEAPLDELLGIIRRHKYSRYPVQDEHGHFVGMVHIKDLLLALGEQPERPERIDLEPLLRPLEHVARHSPLSDLLERFRQGNTHFALIEEADGKVVGYLTMEDALEVLVGDIQDEHRKVERGILSYQPGKLLVRGDTPLFKIERLLGCELEMPEVDTIAGLIYERLKRVPEEGETVDIDHLRLTVKKMRGPKILLVKMVSRDEGEAGAPPNGGTH